MRTLNILFILMSFLATGGGCEKKPPAGMNCDNESIAGEFSESQLAGLNRHQDKIRAGYLGISGTDLPEKLAQNGMNLCTLPPAVGRKGTFSEMGEKMSRSGD